jgi:hypothetical protein
MFYNPHDLVFFPAIIRALTGLLKELRLWLRKPKRVKSGPQRREPLSALFWVPMRG